MQKLQKWIRSIHPISPHQAVRRSSHRIDYLLATLAILLWSTVWLHSFANFGGFAGLLKQPFTDGEKFRWIDCSWWGAIMASVIYWIIVFGGILFILIVLAYRGIQIIRGKDEQSQAEQARHDEHVAIQNEIHSLTGAIENQTKIITDLVNEIRLDREERKQMTKDEDKKE